MRIFNVLLVVSRHFRKALNILFVVIFPETCITLDLTIVSIRETLKTFDSAPLTHQPVVVTSSGVQKC